MPKLDTHKNDNQSSWSRIIQSVSKPIQLIAIVTLIIESIFTVIYLNKGTPESVKSYYPWGTLVFFLIVVILMVVLEIRKPQVIISQDPRPIEGIDDFLNKILNVEARANTKRLLDKIKNLPAIEHPLFVQAMNVDYSEFLNEVENWSNSSVIIQGNRNDDFLFELYSGAKEYVFSTCIEKYIASWDGNFGKRLLDAHQSNPKKAVVNRVFIFDVKESITPDYLEIMKLHKDHKVNVYVYIDRLDAGYQFPSGQPQDFTLIDRGEVIGETQEMKYGFRQTVWGFKKIDRYTILNGIEEHLLNRSISLEDYIKNN